MLRTARALCQHNVLLPASVVDLLTPAVHKQLRKFTPRVGRPGSPRS